MGLFDGRKAKLYKKFVSVEYIFTSSFWIFLLVGLFLYLGGWYLDYVSDDESVLSKFLVTTGQTCLIGTVFSVISKTTYFVDYISDILEEIIYTSGHIDKRKDKEEIWERVTESLFVDKIPGLHHEISETIKQNYIPQSTISYYNNYRLVIKMKWADREKHILCCTEKYYFDLHTIDNKEFVFERTSWYPKTNKSLVNGGERRIVSYKVNGVDKTDDLKPEKVNNGPDEEKCFVYNIKLKGSTLYHIEQCTERYFCLDEDNFIGFRAKWLVNNMDVRISHPKGIKLKYIPRGTTVSFNIVKKEDDCLDIDYKGLILRGQGYIILLNIKD